MANMQVNPEKELEMEHTHNETRSFSIWMKGISSAAAEITDADVLHLLTMIIVSWEKLFNSHQLRDELVRVLVKLGERGESPWLIAAFVSLLDGKIHVLTLARIAQYGCQYPVSNDLFDFCATHGHWQLAEKIARHGVSYDRRKIIEERITQRKEERESVAGILRARHWHKLIALFETRGFNAEEKHDALVVLSTNDEAGTLLALLRERMGLTDEEMRLLNDYGGEKVRQLVDELAAPKDQ